MNIFLRGTRRERPILTAAVLVGGLVGMFLIGNGPSFGPEGLETQYRVAVFTFAVAMAWSFMALYALLYRGFARLGKAIYQFKEPEGTDPPTELRDYAPTTRRLRSTLAGLGVRTPAQRNLFYFVMVSVSLFLCVGLVVYAMRFYHDVNQDRTNGPVTAELKVERAAKSGDAAEVDFIDAKGETVKLKVPAEDYPRLSEIKKENKTATVTYYPGAKVFVGLGGGESH